MSHFSVIVISEAPLDEQSLKPILQPWHEFECTGVRDQYVVEVDKTDEVMEQFNSPVTVLRLADGEVADRYDDSFYVDEPDKIGDRVIGTKKKFVMPEGAKEEEMPADEARKHSLGYLTPEQCAEDYFGIRLYRNGRFYQETNPNKKWDWWTVGGRWSGMFSLGYDPSDDPANYETCWLCQGTGKRKDMEVRDGCNGCRGTGKSLKHAPKWRKVGNVAQKKHIPIEAIRDLAEHKALKEYDRYRPVIEGKPFTTWQQIRDRQIEAKKQMMDDWDAAREEFHGQKVLADLKAAVQAAGKEDEDLKWDLPELAERLTMTRGDRAQQAREQALCPYAFVRDGRWFARGTMGWFGVSHDEEDRAAYSRDFARMLDELSDDTWLAVVDCHI